MQGRTSTQRRPGCRSWPPRATGLVGGCRSAGEAMRLARRPRLGRRIRPRNPRGAGHRHLRPCKRRRQLCPGDVPAARLARLGGYRGRMRQVLQVLARRGAVCLRQSHRYHVGQVNDHAILVGRGHTWHVSRPGCARRPAHERSPQAPRSLPRSPHISRRSLHRAPDEIA